jgi:UDP-N-acetylglucosamine transferase subunit ALG13
VILVTVGTQFFDELIEEVDRLAGQEVIPQPVLAQIGLTPKKPRNVDHVAFDGHLLDTARRADLIITHAGTGSLCEFIALGRPFIAVVNDSKADNHQLEFLEHLSTLYDFCWIRSPRDLQGALPHARPAQPLGRSWRPPLADDIRAFIESRVCAG